MTDHHSEELHGLLDRIKEFVRAEVYPLEARHVYVVLGVLSKLPECDFTSNKLGPVHSSGVQVRSQPASI